MSTIAVNPRERNPGRYPAGRTCSCGAELSRNNPGSLCAPCNGGSWPERKLRTQQVEGDRTELLEELMGQAA